MQLRTWHDYLALMFYAIGFVILVVTALSLGTIMEGFEILPAEMRLALIGTTFFQFWSAITQFVIGWLVAHSKRETLLEPREMSGSEKMALPKSVFTIVKIALVIVTVFLAVLLVFALTQYAYA